MTKTFKLIFTITNRITSGLTRIERARGFLEAVTLSEDWVRAVTSCDIGCEDKANWKCGSTPLPPHRERPIFDNPLKLKVFG